MSPRGALQSFADSAGSPVLCRSSGAVRLSDVHLTKVYDGLPTVDWKFDVRTGRVLELDLGGSERRNACLPAPLLTTSTQRHLLPSRTATTAAVVRASAILRSQRGRKQPPARKVRGTGARKVVKIEEPVA